MIITYLIGMIVCWIYLITLERQTVFRTKITILGEFKNLFTMILVAIIWPVALAYWIWRNV